jgi:hypothetical protein
MADDGKDWSAVLLEPGAELIIGWRPHRSRLDAAAIELSRDVAAELRSMCTSALEQLAGLTRRPYGGVPYIERDEEYLAVPAADLHRTDGGHDADAEDYGTAGFSDLQRLVATAGLPPVSVGELREGHYLLYAVICVEELTGDRIAFVRQTNPHRVAKPGGFMALLGREGLQRLEDPVFVFEAGFDLVVAPDEVAVLRLEAFNRMFADLNTLALAAPANAKVIASTVQHMTPKAVRALAAAAAARPSLARRLQRLARPGAVPPVTAADIARAMASHGLDAADLVSGESIVFSEDGAPVFLDLIEQLYYETDFTGEHRRSDRYSPLKGSPQ